MRYWRRNLVYVVSSLAALFLAQAQATVPDPQQERQYKLEAAFLYNFFNYVTWPGYGDPEDLRAVTICVVGHDPILDYLGYVQQKMSGEREITIREWQEGESLEKCHILYSRNGHLPAAEGTTLTVSSKREGMIVISEAEGHIGLRVNNNVLSKNGFQVSSRLLKIAQEVQ